MTNKKKIEKLQGIISHCKNIKLTLPKHLSEPYIHVSSVQDIAEELIDELQQENTSLQGSVTDLNKILQNVEIKSS